MSLAQLQYPGPNHGGLEEFLQAHARHHEALFTAFKAKGTILPSEPLYPVNVQDMQNWLETHQRIHTALGEATGLQASDLTGLKLDDKKSADDWFFRHFLEHLGVAKASGMPI